MSEIIFTEAKQRLILLNIYSLGGFKYPYVSRHDWQYN